MSELEKIGPVEPAEKDTSLKTEQWGSRMGLILAMAGNAIGLGNFLRFPCKAAGNGGGAFMIPYFIALLLLGIPIMWMEWGMGRFGGRHGHHSLPGTFQRIWKNPVAKYVGVLGLILPLFITVYYNYVESWTLAYSWYSLTGRTAAIETRDEMTAFHSGFTGSRETVAPATAEADPANPRRIAFPFGRTWGEGVYAFDFTLATADGRSVPVTTGFSVARSADAAARHRAAAVTLPPEVASIDPAPGASLKAAPGTIAVTLAVDLKPAPTVGRMRWANTHFDGLAVAYGFFLICFAINIWVIYRGVESGIEALAKVAMPLLFIMAILIAARVLTLPANPAHPDWNILNGLGFVWNPDFSRLADASIWLAAAGQIFFTLSICTGAIQTYASFLKPTDDVTLNGLTTAFTNEFAEVILGGTIAIPAAVLFFGAAETVEIAKGGSFNLGFNAMPMIFGHIPLGTIFGAMWFGLLFFAGITSSVALAYPAVCFFKNELKWSHGTATAFIAIYLFVTSSFVILTFQKGTLDEIDFWAGTFGLALFGFIEVVVFTWIHGFDNAWNEMHLGANLRIPAVYRFIMKYVTPLYILGLMVAWWMQDGPTVLYMTKVAPENVAAIWTARLLMVGTFLLFALLVRVAWSRRTKGEFA